jgi:predicted signal transduction protein with EAL and GGDEF domain
VLLSAGPLVAVVMAARSPALVLLFAFPLAAFYANAMILVQREHQAHHDELTGLSNRQLLVRKTSQALASADATGTKVGFLLLDLDRFKEDNDIRHVAGDRLLRNPHRLLSVRPVTFARLAATVRHHCALGAYGQCGQEVAGCAPRCRSRFAWRACFGVRRASASRCIRRRLGSRC